MGPKILSRNYDFNYFFYNQSSTKSKAIHVKMCEVTAVGSFQASKATFDSKNHGLSPCEVYSSVKYISLTMYSYGERVTYTL